MRMSYEDYQYEQVIKDKVAVVENTLTRAQIEKIANSLVHRKIDNKDVFGYVTQSKDKNNVCCKWDKESEVFVIYKDEKILSSKTKTFRQYNSDKAVEYIDEIKE